MSWTSGATKQYLHYASWKLRRATQIYSKRRKHVVGSFILETSMIGQDETVCEASRVAGSLIFRWRAQYGRT